MTIHTILVEDHKVVSHGLKSLIESEEDISVIAQLEDGVSAIEFAKSNKKAVFVLDIALPKLNGLETAAQILKKNPKAKVLILSAHADDAYIERAIEIKVSGYLIKQCSPGHLIEAIRKINQGENFYSPYIIDRISYFEKNSKSSTKNERQHLSVREIQVLQKIANGMTNKLIATELKISIKTVEKHRQNLMNKLSIHDTASLTRYAITEGLIDITWFDKIY